MTETTTIEEKVRQIISEMKSQNIWKKEPPEWVTDYEEKRISIEQDFAGWLQFVFLPNCLQGIRTRQVSNNRNYIVLQVKRFLSNDMQKGKLLQLLIELDALV